MLTAYLMPTAYYLYSTRYAVYDPETCVFQYYLCAQDAETDKKRQGGVVVVSTLLYKERFGFHTKCGALEYIEYIANSE